MEVLFLLMVGFGRLSFFSILERLELWRLRVVGKGRGLFSGEGVLGWLVGVRVLLLLLSLVVLFEFTLVRFKFRLKGV